jgi:hypothetical protein
MMMMMMMMMSSSQQNNDGKQVRLSLNYESVHMAVRSSVTAI